ncbi:MAG TPA: tetratricopeptide repeat protein, partial [Burkholderiaceae bacterium]
GRIALQRLVPETPLYRCRPMLPPPSRRAPCPCGSGKRYKDCHGTLSSAAALPGAAIAALLVQAHAALEAGRAIEAVDLLQRATALEPNNAEPFFHLGNLLAQRGDTTAAIGAYERALEMAPAHAQLRVNLGITLCAAGEIAKGERCFDEVLQRQPQHVGALGNLAQSLFRREQFAAALAIYDRLSAVMPEAGVEIWNNRGICQQRLGARLEAEQSFRRALALAPESAEVAANLGLLLSEGGNHEAARPVLARAHALDPGRLLVTAQLLHAQLQAADWNDFERRRDEILAVVASLDEHPRQSLPPYILLAICDDPALQLAAARRWAWPQQHPAIDRAPLVRRHGDRLHIGFVSSAFHEHPVPRLLVDLVERLDRGRFRIHAYVLGRGPDDALRARIERAVDVFAELRHLATAEIVNRIRSDGIDILFDLTGHTGQARPDVFAARPAPVQVNYLGYAGTLGARYWDFVITDPYTTPAAEQAHFSERFCNVGDCYLPSDSRRAMAASPPSRSAYGLPDSAFVLATAAAAYKILPPLFDTWMRLLRSLPAAVLWLRPVASMAAANLRAEAVRRGVDPQRLVFAPDEPLPAYLARYALADLFLDSYPFGSHTAVNDALFAGLPVVSIAGRSMAARASATQLRAAGLPELVAADGSDYETIACELAGARDRLLTLRLRLRREAHDCPLFDMGRYTRAFEAALERMGAEARSRQNFPGDEGVGFADA